MLEVNGTRPDTINFNNNSVDEVKYNNNTVWANKTLFEGVETIALPSTRTLVSKFNIEDYVDPYHTNTPLYNKIKVAFKVYDAEPIKSLPVSTVTLIRKNEFIKEFTANTSVYEEIEECNKVYHLWSPNPTIFNVGYKTYDAKLWAKYVWYNDSDGNLHAYLLFEMDDYNVPPSSTSDFINLTHGIENYNKIEITKISYEI